MITTAAWAEDLIRDIEVQDVMITYKGASFRCLIIPNVLEGLQNIVVAAPDQWVDLFHHGNYEVGGSLDFLLGQSLGALAPDQQAKHGNVKLYLSNFTGNYMLTGCTMSKEDNPNKVNIKKFSMLEDLSREFIRSARTKRSPGLKQ